MRTGHDTIRRDASDLPFDQPNRFVPCSRMASTADSLSSSTERSSDSRSHETGFSWIVEGLKGSGPDLIRQVGALKKSRSSDDLPK